MRKNKTVLKRRESYKTNPSTDLYLHKRKVWIEEENKFANVVGTIGLESATVFPNKNKAKLFAKKIEHKYDLTDMYEVVMLENALCELKIHNYFVAEYKVLIWKINPTAEDDDKLKVVMSGLGITEEDLALDLDYIWMARRPKGRNKNMPKKAFW